MARGKYIKKGADGFTEYTNYVHVAIAQGETLRKFIDDIVHAVYRRWAEKGTRSSLIFSLLHDYECYKVCPTEDREKQLNETIDEARKFCKSTKGTDDSVMSVLEVAAADYGYYIKKNGGRDKDAEGLA